MDGVDECRINDIRVDGVDGVNEFVGLDLEFSFCTLHLAFCIFHFPSPSFQLPLPNSKTWELRANT